MKSLSLLTLYFFVGLSLTAQNARLQSGPMLGYAHSKEVMLWVQTTTASTVYAEYWAAATPDQKHKTEAVTTQRAQAYAVHLLADEVQPGIKYEYAVWIDGKKADLPYPTTFETPVLWQYRKDPPALKIALGSCAYINEAEYDRPTPKDKQPYGGDYEIFSAIYKQQPQLMLWLGDNVYYREVDWYSRTGMMHRNTHTRSLPELQPFLASTQHIAIWDDHDYGPNDSDRTFTAKDISLEVFNAFWANPTPATPENGIRGVYEWGDVQFFLTDNRYHRSPNDIKTVRRDYFGQAQLQWLKESLVSSKAAFKFVMVGGQVLNDAALYENLSAISPHERDSLLAWIAAEEIEHVIFLTGDRHHSELSMLELTSPKGKKIKVYDWTVSPLTSGVHSAENEANTLRVSGSYFAVRNFGLLNITGERKKRVLQLQIFDYKGEKLWEYEIGGQ